MSSILKILSFLGLALLLVMAAMLNADARVSITYLPGATLRSVPVFVVILGSMFAGVVVAGLVSLADQVRLRRRQRQLERELADLRRELRKLRNLSAEGR